MEPLTLDDLDLYFSHDYIFDESESEEEDITCTSCARGRIRQTILMPRLPGYKIVHQKKVDFKRSLGVAESDISKQRVLGRGRAKASVVKLPPPVGGPDPNSESSADERIKHVGLSSDTVKWTKELRKPKTKPKILSQDFAQLSSPFQTEGNSSINKKNEISKVQDFPQLSVSEESPATKESGLSNGTTNLQDMANFLMDSWKDEVGIEGQFEDVSSKTEIFTGEEFKELGMGENLNNNSETECDSSIQKKADEYFNRLTQEVDNDLDLDDFENIEVSESSNLHFSLNSNSHNDQMVETKSKSANAIKTKSGIWYSSSDEVYVSKSANDADFSDDTSISISTESLLPCDKSPSDKRNYDSDNVQNVRFDLLLPGGSINSQENICHNAITTSSPERDHSTLSISKTESESKRTTATSEKDESEVNEELKKLSRKEKKKKRDASHAKVFHEKHPGKGKPNTDTDSLEIDKCQKNSSGDANKPCSINGTTDIPDNNWKLVGESVLQLDGLPVNCDISALQDLIASYGTVLDSEKKVGTISSSVRFRLNSIDSCEMVVSCLHDTDIFPDAASKITCVVVQ